MLKAQVKAGLKNSKMSLGKEEEKGKTSPKGYFIFVFLIFKYLHLEERH